MRKLIIKPVCFIGILFCIASQLSAENDKRVILKDKDVEVILHRPLRLNDINFISVKPGDTYSGELRVKLTNPEFPEVKYESTIRKSGDDTTADILFADYFFLPNVIPAGKNTLNIVSGDEVIMSMEVDIQTEKTFHSPLYIKGFPEMTDEIETGMRQIKPKAYRTAVAALKKTLNGACLFLRARTVEADHADMTLRLERRQLVDIKLNSVFSSFIYCFTQEEYSKKSWMLLEIETMGEEKQRKVVSTEWEYIILLPFEMLPEWITKLKDFKGTL